jgi:3-keto-disaccharide hydrolase
MRFYSILLVGLIAAAALAPARAQTNPFLGAWNLTGAAPNEDNVYWLEVKDEGGKLSAMFLNRGGSPVPGNDVKITGDELTFVAAVSGNAKPVVTLRASGDTLNGTVKVDENTVKVTGARPPKWGPCDANAKHTFGKPVALFDGSSMAAWDVQHKGQPSKWAVEDGAMTNNPPRDNNLVSKEKFRDFKLDAEYKVSPKGNSGIYLRGRYEFQVLDDAGTPPESHGHMAIYSRRAPDVNASKPAGEWQTAQITIVGNCVTAVLNGKTVHNNVRLPAITGGALDAKETEPGPIMIQGDHEKVWFKKVIVTPIVSGSKSF